MLRFSQKIIKTKPYIKEFLHKLSNGFGFGLGMGIAFKTIGYDRNKSVQSISKDKKSPF
jgi:hypothetical protein